MSWLQRLWFWRRRAAAQHAVWFDNVPPETPGWDGVDEASWESFPCSDPPAH